MRKTITLVLAFLLAGCTGQISLIPVDRFSLPPRNTYTIDDAASNLGKGYPGIIVYLGRNIVEHDEFTQIQEHFGSTIITTSHCDPKDEQSKIRKIVQMADHNHPYLLAYNHGILESYTFNVTLGADGTLTGVSTTASPDQGKTFSNVAGPLGAISGTVPKFSSTQPYKLYTGIPCTITPVFEKYTYPDDVEGK